jgi:signal transduction histidine kinase
VQFDPRLTDKAAVTFRRWRREGQMSEETGASARQLARFGRRYAGVVRVATALPIGAISVLRAPPDVMAAQIVLAGVLVAWTCGYAWWLTHTDRVLLPLTLDVVGVLAGCLVSAIAATTADVVGDRGPLRLLVTFAAVTYQWYAPPLVGGLAAVVTIGAMLGTSVMVGADADVLRVQAWALVASGLSRAAWLLVVRAATRADALAAKAEQARRASHVEAAVRADERELANALHDTAATTLLMVGSGQVPAGAGWLAPQASRDLERLRTDGRRPPEHADLVTLLREDLDAVHIAVEFDGPERLPLPFGVARAIADATREALNNVRRHAGVDRAVVRLCADAGGLRLEVVDEGKGFPIDDVPATRRGLRHSVRGRMSRVGGTATVVSAVGEGTVVRLEWCAGRG